VTPRDRDKPASTPAPAAASPARARRRLWALALLLVSFWASPATGYDFEISSRTEGYGYQLRRLDRDGVQFLNRRRLTQYLGLRVFNILDDGASPFKPGSSTHAPALLTFHALLRFDTDFGGYASPDHASHEIQNNVLDLMVAALEARNLFGWIDFTLGRQLDTELMDFFAFDGLRLRLRTPWHFYLEAHGGTQVFGAHPFSSAVFEPDGVSGETSQEAWAPTFGAAIGTDDLRWLHLRLAYRGVASRAPRLPGSGGRSSDPLWGVDQELIFFSGAVEEPWLHTRALFGLRYSLLTGAVDDIQLTVVVPLGRFEAQVEVLRARPHYEGDSIFNLFALEPFSELSGRASLRLLDARLTLLARGGHRWFWADEKDTGYSRGALTVGVGAAWRSERWRATLEGYYLGGQGGTSYGGDLDGAWAVMRRLSLEGRLSLIRTTDDVARRDLLNFGVQAGARVKLVRGVQLLLLGEDNVSRIYRSALRVLGVLDLELAP
jgi:hypothetical protein